MRVAVQRLASVRLAALASLVSAGCAAVSGARPAHDALALVGGTVWPSPDVEPIADGVVLVEHGRIVAVGARDAVSIPPSARVLDCAGRVVTAGFWNSHVHLFGLEWEGAASIPADVLARQLEDAFTRHGFTTVFDTGSRWENTRCLRDRIESGEVAGPRILSTGEPLLAPGALPSADVLRGLGIMPLSACEVVSADEARAAVRGLVAEGVDAIKLHMQPPPAPRAGLSPEVVRAAVDEAHRHGRPVFVHPDRAADVVLAARSGADVIAHTTPASGPWDDEVLASMAQAGVALTPTLALWESEVAVEELRAWSGRGGVVLFGNDFGAVASEPGRELAAMELAGLDFRARLASLTTAPAERFGAADRCGRIAPGLEADLVVLAADPRDARDGVASLADVRVTLRAGCIVHAAR